MAGDKSEKARQTSESVAESGENSESGGQSGDEILRRMLKTPPSRKKVGSGKNDVQKSRTRSSGGRDSRK